MILHAGDAHFVGEDELLAEAIWTRGRRSARGYVVWRRDPANRSDVAAWAVGRTAIAAQDSLDQWRRVTKAEFVDPDDAIAMAEVAATFSGPEAVKEDVLLALGRAN